MRGRPYSPETLDKKFREMMRTGLFNILQVKPTPVEGNLLRLDVNLEEAKPEEFGFSIGYGSFDGGIVGRFVCEPRRLRLRPADHHFGRSVAAWLQRRYLL